MRTVIDINCDLGEGMGADSALLNLVSSANIACGGHAGDARSMSETVALAKARGVAIGAHPSYADREGFGRRPQTLSAPVLEDLIRSQTQALENIAAAQGLALSHLRAHGALGNLTDSDPAAAKPLLAAMRGSSLALMTLGGSAAEQLARVQGIRVVRQFFADRAYDDAGQLVSRQIAGSVVHDTDAVIRRLLDALDTGFIQSHSGKRIAVSFDTLCVHGDTPDALALAESIRQVLEQQGVAIRPFTETLPP